MMTAQTVHAATLSHATNRSTKRAGASTMSRLQQWWSKRRNEKALESLPPEIRKDIGWPTPTSLPSQRH